MSRIEFHSIDYTEKKVRQFVRKCGGRVTQDLLGRVGVSLWPRLPALHDRGLAVGVVAVALDAELVALEVDARDRRQALDLHVALLEVLVPYPELQAQGHRLQALAALDGHVRALHEVLVDLKPPIKLH